MTTYETSLLLGALFGVFTLSTLASLLLDSGSFKFFVICGVITGASLYVAEINSAGGISVDDIAPALTKFVGQLVG